MNWRANDHTAECASWRTVMAGGISMDVNQRPNAKKVRLPCDCRLAQPEPAACEYDANAALLRAQEAKAYAETRSEPLARDMTAYARVAIDIYCALRSSPMNPVTARQLAFKEAGELLAALEVK